MKARSIIALAAAAMLGSSAFGAQLFFTTTSTLSAAGAVTASGVNPTLTLTTAAPTASLFVWAKLTAPQRNEDDTDPLNPVISYTPTERFNGFGLDTVLGVPSGVTAGNFSVNNAAARFDAPNNVAGPVAASGEFVGAPTSSSPNANVIDRFKRGAVQKLGITDMIAAATLGDDNNGDVFDTGAGNIVGADGFVYVKVATVPITGNTSGTYSLFFQTNAGVLAMSNGDASHINLGSGDPAVNGGTAGGGIKSSVADATIQVNLGVGTTPEPASLSLLALGGLGLVRRRRA